jgi:hypothetical protein
MAFHLRRWPQPMANYGYRLGMRKSIPSYGGRVVSRSVVRLSDRPWSVARASEKSNAKVKID